jgi:hypothetical protein
MSHHRVACTRFFKPALMFLPHFMYGHIKSDNVVLSRAFEQQKNFPSVPIWRLQSLHSKTN